MCALGLFSLQLQGECMLLSGYKAEKMGIWKLLQSCVSTPSPPGREGSWSTKEDTESVWFQILPGLFVFALPRGYARYQISIMA